MNVYINFKFIKDKLDDLITAPSAKIALIDFFKVLLQSLNKHLTSHLLSKIEERVIVFY
jgi:hypothetical protein